MRIRPWLGWAALAAALALLNFALTFANLWPTPWIRPQAAASIELAVAVLLAALAVWRRGPLSPRALGLLSAAFVVLVLTRYAEVMARELYGRPINLYYDLPHVPRVLAMFAEATPDWVLFAISAGVALGLIALYGVVRWAWGRIRGRARRAASARRAGGSGARAHRGLSVRPGVVPCARHRELPAPGGARGASSPRRRRGSRREPAAGLGSCPGPRHGRLRRVPRVVRRGDLRSPRYAGPLAPTARVGRRGRGDGARLVSARSSRRRSAARPGSPTRACCRAWRCATPTRTTR